MLMDRVDKRSGIPTQSRPSDQLSGLELSPYRRFPAAMWAEFRADTPLTLDEDEVMRLRSLDDPVDLDEVRRIYLSMSRLLYSHVEASQSLFEQRQQFLNIDGAIKTPFIIGIAGSVSVGKSTTARILKELLGRWPSSPRSIWSPQTAFCCPTPCCANRG